MNAVRWGILGTARINRRLIPALRTARRSQLLAVASRSGSRAHDFAREWQIPSAHASYDALLRDPTVDAVYVPLPNALHVQWTLRALDAGKHVLCEKPLALTAEDVDRIAAVAGDRQRHIAEAFMYRYEPLTARLLELLRGGAVGGLRHIAAGFTIPARPAGDIRLDAALGGGSLWDVGCYAVDVARLIAGEPTAVFGTAQHTDSDVDETFDALLQFPGGVSASLHCSFRAAYRNWLQVTGETATLFVDSPFKPDASASIEVRREYAVERVTAEVSPTLFVRQVESFIATALDERPPAIRLEDSRGNAAALAALHISARSCRLVDLS